MMRGFWHWFMLGSTAFWATGAHATLNYVGAVNSYPYAGNADGRCGWVGTCVLCHLADPGTKGTVVKPFGKALMDEYGLVANADENGPLVAALGLAEADELDADKDGVPDVDEICGGGDPNNANIGLGGAAPAVSPEFGCMGTIASNTAPSNGWVCLVAALASLALGLKRRRRHNCRKC